MSDVRIAPAVWPGPPLAVQPGDLRQFAPHGLGIGPPLVMLPWDSLGDMLGRSNFYGLDADRTGNVFTDAPRTDAGGGTVYFSERVEPGALRTLFEIVNLGTSDTFFAAFEHESPDPVRDRYLVQRRIVPANALSSLFGIPPAAVPKELVQQPIDVGAAILGFLDGQRERWGRGMDSKLEGTLGGDGDWAREALAFGLMVENADNGIVRIWSRPWLVTK